MEPTEQNLLNLLASGDNTAFESLFKAHFKSLHGYAIGLLQDESTAEEMVQQVFFKIWERRQRLKVHTSFKAFLYRAVHNECINFLKQLQNKAKYRGYMQHAQRQNMFTQNVEAGMEAAELSRRLQLAIGELPEQCGLIFCLSRFEELKYREIAVKLGISVKTVEAQVTKAMKLLKKKLAL
ncbi:MAG TPA: RNA polymerase sigma-70 factor [Chitinophagaceae bacterium]|nr:RNA polymerase sigma-70 factor [Chitinophagaceae bacterium]